MNSPTPAAPPPHNRGSMLLGFGLAWAVIVVGYVFVFGIVGAMTGYNEGGIFLLFALPLIAAIGLIVLFAMQGRPRAAIGVAIGLASIVGLVLLLVAACFGILASSGFH